METNINYTIVGAIVIVSFAIFIMAIIWLSSGFSFETNTNYLTYMKESVSGLSLDAPVEFNGVEVGSVQSIQLDKKNPQLVEVLLRIKSSTPLTQGTYATLTTRGVTGSVFIALKDKSTDLRPLVALPGQDYPVIPTAPSIFVRFDAALTQISTSFQKISDALSSLLNQENQTSIKETLLNIKKVTHMLEKNTQNLDDILLDTKRTIHQFGPFLQSGTSTLNVLKSQTLPAAYQMFNNLNTVAKNLTDVSNELKQNPSVLIRGSTQPSLGPGETNEN